MLPKVAVFVISIFSFSCLVGVEAAKKQAGESAKTVNLTVNFKGLRSPKGKVLVRLYASKKGFPEKMEEAVVRLALEIKDGVPLQAKFPGLSPGSYAVSAVHDENDNGEMDTNWIGIPREGLAVSRDAKGSFGPPSFEDSVLQVTEDQQIEVNFVYL